MVSLQQFVFNSESDCQRKIMLYKFMQELLSSPLLKQINHPSPQSQNDEEGFAEEKPESLIVPKHEVVDDFSITKLVHPKPKVRYRQPKLKLTFIAKDKDSTDQIRRAIVKKQDRNCYGRSLDLSKRESRQTEQLDLFCECVVKIKRTVVGDNIAIPIFSLSDSKAIKAFILTGGGSLIYELPKEVNTHGYLRSVTEKSESMLNWHGNRLIRNKLKESFIMSKRQSRLEYGRAIEFNGQFESGNLEFAAQTGEDQYDLYLKNDTNTHGHQSWFNFRIRNNQFHVVTIQLSICNIKRDLRLFQQGQRIFMRKIDEMGEPLQDWRMEGNKFQFKVNNNAKFSNSRVYRLSFELTVQAAVLYQISLLPSYSYTQMLKDICPLQSNPNVTIQCLTYSLIGLAIPMLTFTNKDRDDSLKNVTLVSCRIHPGQSNASYTGQGLIKTLASQDARVRQYLDKNIIKVIPMINPDGVVFGNFRTNFLGVDLNRSFDSEDEVTNPEIVALKELGLRLKSEYGDRFEMFLDLHGHSFEKNAFSYGPDYDSSEANFYQIRMLPKILSMRSRYFKYGSCTFRLEDYKRHTARGFFLGAVGINAYTIESSYSIFTEEGKNELMGVNDWHKLGCEIVESLGLLSKLNRLSSIKNRVEMKKALGEADREHIEIIRKFKKEFKHEKQQTVQKVEVKIENGGEDSDGENQCEDYNKNQRDEIVRRVIQNTAPATIFPRVLKPAIVYPTVTPKLFNIHEQFDSVPLHILYTKRGPRYSGLRMGNSYIHSLRGIEMRKADMKRVIFQ